MGKAEGLAEQAETLCSGSGGHAATISVRLSESKAKQPVPTTAFPTRKKSPARGWATRRRMRAALTL